MSKFYIMSSDGRYYSRTGRGPGHHKWIRDPKEATAFESSREAFHKATKIFLDQPDIVQEVSSALITQGVTLNQADGFVVASLSGFWPHSIYLTSSGTTNVLNHAEVFTELSEAQAALNDHPTWHILSVTRRTELVLKSIFV